MTDKKKSDGAKRKGPAPAAEDVLDTADRARRAERSAPERGGRPLHREETAPGERGDAPYGDSEPGDRRARPGTTPRRP